MHFLGEPLIDLEDGADEGSLDTYAVVYQLGDAGAGQTDLTLGIRYLDDVVVTRDGGSSGAARRGRSGPDERTTPDSLSQMSVLAFGG